MVLRGTIGVFVAAMLAASMTGASAQTLQPSPSALPAVQAPVIVAQDASCANACQTQHDRCRVQTKGSPSCDADRQRCLQTCIANKRR